MSITAEIKTLLAGTSGLYVGSMPATPDNCVVIYPSGGYPRSLSGTYLEEPTVMIKVRNLSYTAGETVCEVVKTALHGNSTTKALMVEQQGDINDLGRDANNRSEFSINFRCYYRK